MSEQPLQPEEPLNPLDQAQDVVNAAAAHDPYAEALRSAQQIVDGSSAAQDFPTTREVRDPLIEAEGAVRHAEVGVALEGLSQQMPRLVGDAGAAAHAKARSETREEMRGETPMPQPINRQAISSSPNNPYKKPPEAEANPVAPDANTPREE